MPKIAELKLSSCGLEVADFRKNCDCGIAELRLRSSISVKSCGITIAEVLPSSCGIVIVDSKKSCACPPLPRPKKGDNVFYIQYIVQCVHIRWWVMYKAYVRWWGSKIEGAHVKRVGL